MPDINSISPDVRDYLLNSNLIPFTDTSFANGVGLPVDINASPIASTDVTTIDENDEEYRTLHTITNPYKANGENEEFTLTNEPFLGNSNVSGGQYQAPENLTKSPLSDDQNSFPYSDQRNVTFLTNQNLYSDPDQQTDVSFSMYNVNPITEQMKSYIDERGVLRGGVAYKDNPADVIGALISGRQIGYSPDGPQPNFDLRSSIVGRALGPTIGDTPLGLIGGQELLNAMMANAASNAQSDTLGRVNVHGLFKKNEDFILPNYEITVRDGFLGKGLDLLENIAGGQIPSSNIIKDDASIFTMDASNMSSESRGQNLLSKYTGRGQVNALFANLGMNVNSSVGNNILFRYTPGYEDTRILGKDKKLFENLYTTPASEYREPASEFISLKNKDSDLRKGDNVDGEFTWRQDQTTIPPTIPTFEEFLSQQKQPQLLMGSEAQDLSIWTETQKMVYNTQYGNQISEGALEPTVIHHNQFGNSPTSLLSKTQWLFNQGKIKSLVSGQHKGAAKDELQSATVEINGVESVTRGSNVLGEDGLPCRSWTTFKRYDDVLDLQKNSGLIGNDKARYRNNTEQSVLDDNGFPIISPYATDSGDVKRYMFSIENLAWADVPDAQMYKCEIGNGDPQNPDGTRGRIMWFPPYDITFTDNVSVDWTSTNFIGRGEPVYTYNNTERSGTLGFKMIIDHASFINDASTRQQLTDDLMASINSGCKDVPDLVFTHYTPQELAQKEIEENITPAETTSNLDYRKEFEVYFPNDTDDTSQLTTYENGDGLGLGSTYPSGKYFRLNAGAPYDDNTDFGLNDYEDSLVKVITDFPKFLNEECPSCKIVIEGYASQQGEVAGAINKKLINQRLSDDRAKAIEQWIIDQVGSQIDGIKDRFLKRTGNGESANSLDGAEDSEGPKKGRVVFVSIENVDEKDIALVPDVTTNDSITATVIGQKTKSKFYSECTYFEKMKKSDNESDKFVYENISSYIKHFHPSFHSTTPEGFNSRLNFLHQCTRQGNSMTANKPDNLAFGRPPVCILRIGDFYNTRIIIDNISFSFEPLVWDLNPEGVGVQPMIAQVDMTFKFLGGSSMQGPINKLQNAVSFNFFANTEIYDSRADTVKNGSIITGSTESFDIINN